MDLILWRHAEAEPGDPDLGRRDVEGTEAARADGRVLELGLPETTRILVSPADRTQQTALALGRKFKTSDDVAPGSSHRNPCCW